MRVGTHGLPQSRREERPALLRNDMMLPLNPTYASAWSNVFIYKYVFDSKRNGHPTRGCKVRKTVPYEIGFDPRRIGHPTGECVVRKTVLYGEETNDQSRSAWIAAVAPGRASGAPSQ